MDVTARMQVEGALKEESCVLELLNDTGTAIAAELDFQTLVQKVTDSATELRRASRVESRTRDDEKNRARRP